jgi:predicted transglutaminase-like cysteine proteinase
MHSQNLTTYHFERWDMQHSNDGDYEDYTLRGRDTVQSDGVYKHCICSEGEH